MTGSSKSSKNAKWYVVHTYSGYENKVKTNLEKIIENRSLEDLIIDIRVPTEDVVESKGEEKKIVTRKIFPGYVLIKMVMTDDTWYIIRNTTGVTGFVGPGSEPTPLTDAEIEMFSVEVSSEEFKLKIGDKVEVVSGIFVGYSGVLQEISEDKKQLTILASTERRDIPIIVDTKDVRIVD